MGFEYGIRCAGAAGATATATALTTLTALAALAAVAADLDSAGQAIREERGCNLSLISTIHTICCRSAGSICASAALAARTKEITPPAASA
jgi:hypothetical protein